MDYEPLAEAVRGSVVENIHFGVAAVANANGEVIGGWGNPDYVSYPRSSLKPIQAIALLETGAADAFDLTEKHIAIACASHRAEPHHVELAEEWLGRLGLDEAALACGPALPRGTADRQKAIRQDGESRIYNNCSGKHCGFLTVSKHMGWDHAGYNQLDHPTEQLYVEVLSDLLAKDARQLAFGVDGCTLPAPAISVGDMARMMARFAAGKTASGDRQRAIFRVQNAMRQYPEYVSGIEQPTDLLVRATKGQIVMKSGAAGFMAAFLPEQQLGVSLKIVNGDSSSRVLVFLTLLMEMGLLEDTAIEQLSNLFIAPITNSAGTEVGEIHMRPHPDPSGGARVALLSA